MTFNLYHSLGNKFYLAFNDFVKKTGVNKPEKYIFKGLKKSFIEDYIAILQNVNLVNLTDSVLLDSCSSSILRNSFFVESNKQIDKIHQSYVSNAKKWEYKITINKLDVNIFKNKEVIQPICKWKLSNIIWEKYEDKSVGILINDWIIKNSQNKIIVRKLKLCNISLRMGCKRCMDCSRRAR